MLKRLKVKFVAAIMVIAAAMLCLVFGLVYRFTQANLEQESIAMMQSIAANPFQLGRPDDRPEQVRLPYFMLQIGARGEIIAAGGGYYDLSDQEFLATLLNACARHKGQVGVIEEYSLRFCRADTPMGPRIVFADITSERSTLYNLAETCIIIGTLCFFAFLGLAILLVSWMVRPVDRAWAQQRQFVADASHELKTPLTVIMTNAELLQGRDWGEDERARFSKSILTVSRQMRNLIERLLELARVDHGQDMAAFGAVDLSALVEKALLPFEPVFFERGLEFSSSIDGDIVIHGSGEQLGQVIDILLDNAQKYAAHEGRVTVALKRAGKHCCRLSVSSPGAALSETECKDIFKRFYRIDKARSQNGSFGLGLSIAQGIVERHRGRIWAESRDGYNTFYVETPVGAVCKGPKGKHPEGNHGSFRA